MSASAILWVAVGGAAGSVARYLSMIGVGHLMALGYPGFPFGTLFVNIVGSLAMGVLAELGALVWQPAPDLRLFLTVGVLGGFTTFSTFSLDVALLVERHDWIVAFAYIAASVVLSVGALFAGMAMVRAVV